MRSRNRPPRFIRFLVGLLVPRSEREFFLGDLDEMFAGDSNPGEQSRSWFRESVGIVPLVLESLRLAMQHRQKRGDGVISGCVRDVRFGSRMLVRNPGFTAVAIVTLALGIGANTAIFSLVNGILLKPLPFDEPNDLVGVWHKAPGLDFNLLNQAPALHLTYLDEAQSFAELGIWDNDYASVTGLAEPEEVEMMLVTAGTFRALRLEPLLGRRFLNEDEDPETPLTVILSYDYWQTRFGGDVGVLGRTLTVESRPREIIGVLGPDVRFLDFDPAFYLPFRFGESQYFAWDFSYQALARMAPGVSLAQANADLARLLPVAVERFPGEWVTHDLLEQGQFAPDVRPLRADVVRDVGEVLWVLQGAVGIILLIACANVANLFLVRAEGREREMAVRAAMGAGRSRIAREFLNESLLLGGLGGIAGIALAFGGLELLRATGPARLPRLADVSLDWGVLLFALSISLFSGVFFGLFPILKFRWGAWSNALREGGRSLSSGKERHRARNTLVVAQIALALLLLVGSGLLIRTFQALRNVDPGFRNADEVLTVRLSIPVAQVEDPLEVTQTHSHIAERINRIPGVASVGSSSSVTMDGRQSNNPVYVEEFPVPEGQTPELRRYKYVSDSYFETMQIPLLAGRTLDWSDSRDLNKAVVVTENFAQEYWGSPSDAVGKRIATVRNPQNWYEIVGVSGNVRDDGVDRDPTPAVYWPMRLRNPWATAPEADVAFARRSMNYAIRSARVGSPELLAEVREAIWGVNPNLPLAEVRTLDEILDRSMARTSFTLIMLGIAAAVALILGTIGIYGVISYIVSQRTRELGVRLALGANAGDVRKMVLKHGLILCAFGILIGLGAAFMLTRLMGALLYGVNPVDPMTFGLVAVSLTVVALVASYIPAARAASIDPVEAIRYEV